MTPAADADYTALQRTIAELTVENETLRADNRVLLETLKEIREEQRHAGIEKDLNT